MPYAIRASFLILSFTLAAQHFPTEFQRRAMAHVEFLAGLANRVAGTPNESKAIDYIQTQMKQAGLQVATEPFLFESFELDRITLRVGDQTATAGGVVLDVYGALTIRAAAVFLEPAVVEDPKQLTDVDVDSKIAVTTGDARLFLISLYKKPQAVVLLSPADFERLRKQPADSAELEVAGRRVEVHSANVVGTLRTADTQREIILSAHHDSWTGPGASDNASGVAVVLELARYFAGREKPLPFRLRFVTFGAEESGMLGSRAYLTKHQAELEKCELLFNADTLGGQEFYVEMAGGVSGIPGRKGQSQLPDSITEKATNDLLGRWMLRPDWILDASNVPTWLEQTLQETAKEIGMVINRSRQMGSDHRIFAQAGIVSTDIASSPGKTHTPEDLPRNIRPESLERAARLIAGVVERIR